MGCALALAKQGYFDIHVWEAASSLGGESEHLPLRRERAFEAPIVARSRGCSIIEPARASSAPDSARAVPRIA